MNVVRKLSNKYGIGRGCGLKKEERNISITGVRGLSQNINLNFRGIKDAG
jgi:hypothetical protein